MRSFSFRHAKPESISAKKRLASGAGFCIVDPLII
jgi:hypothetical protein